ncbi:MAG: formate/nitrite transporter family protein [Bacteroides sp.]|nr:formate/nitrite transporter family protein [Bacteroides sp.]MCM1457935.1 formate/nitrite transporter family protein [Lachnoclostridium sp.]
MKDSKFIARGILAGVCISMGGCIFLKTGGVAGAILFAFGLIAVVSLGLNLFTGKARFVWGPAPDQSAQGGYAWLLAILILNIIGCMLMGMLMSDASMQTAAQAVIDKRLASSPLRNGILAIGCGFIMTLAVQGTDKGRWLPLLFGIPAFILCGFPHCIADAFYMASLPLDYITAHAADLSAFYCAIVAGNFLGCNAYRLTAQSSQLPSSQTSQLPNSSTTQLPD